MSQSAILIDGGFSTQLAKYIANPIGTHPLWTARYLLEDKDACINVHKDFIRAGSRIIRTNTYQASREGLTKYLNITDEEALKLIYDGVDFCRKAIEEEKHPANIKVKIGGSVGPYGAFLHDGSEYTGSYTNSITSEELKEWHAWRMKALIDAGVDLLTIETIPCSKEALAVIDLLKTFPNVKAWVSFTARSGTEISNGENFANVAAECWKSGQDQLLAVGVNCCNPQYVSPLFDSLIAKDPSIPFIAYPNSGEIFDVTTKEWIEQGRAKRLPEFVGEWLDKGITYVGGCCRNSAEEIYDIGLALRNWENRIC